MFAVGQGCVKKAKQFRLLTSYAPEQDTVHQRDTAAHRCVAINKNEAM
jgi:hypothetical protein